MHALLGTTQLIPIPCKVDGGIDCPAPPKSLCDKIPRHPLCPIKDDPCRIDPSGLSCPTPKRN